MQGRKAAATNTRMKEKLRQGSNKAGLCTSLLEGIGDIVIFLLTHDYLLDSDGYLSASTIILPEDVDRLEQVARVPRTNDVS